MPRLQATFDLQPMQTRMRGVPRLVRAHVRRRLSYWGRYHIKDIRKHSNVFKYSQGKRGNPGEPHLVNSLWTRRGKGRDPIQHIGWGVPWGEVLEFGPRRKFVWPIFPKGFRSDKSQGRSGGGVALKFLRFEWKGKIVYSKGVIHRWKKGELRPHVEPSLKRHERGFHADMGSITQRVIEGKLT